MLGYCSPWALVYTDLRWAEVFVVCVFLFVRCSEYKIALYYKQNKIRKIIKINYQKTIQLTFTTMTITTIAWKTGTRITAECIRTVGKYITGTWFALVFIWHKKRKREYPPLTSWHSIKGKIMIIIIIINMMTFKVFCFWHLTYLDRYNCNHPSHRCNGKHHSNTRHLCTECHLYHSHLSCRCCCFWVKLFGKKRK